MTMTSKIIFEEKKDQNLLLEDLIPEHAQGFENSFQEYMYEEVWNHLDKGLIPEYDHNFDNYFWREEWSKVVGQGFDSRTCPRFQKFIWFVSHLSCSAVFQE